MLIRFAVENFLSFKELTEFNMTAGKMTRHKEHVALCNGKRILKGSFVFGANAGGKTNLIRAISFARSIIENGLENTNCDKKYFRIDSEYKNKPSVFQFDIFAGGHFYSYGFAISLLNASIEEEWLYRIGDRDECIFLRSLSEDGDKLYTLSTDLKLSATDKPRFDVYAEDICSKKMHNKLFLTDIVMRSPDDAPEYQAFRDVVEWFARLIIIFPGSRYRKITQLMENDSERTRLETLLNYFDTGIDRIEKKETEFSKAFSSLPEDVVESLKTNIAKQLKNRAASAQIEQEDSRFEVKYKDGELVAFRVVANHGNGEDLFEYADESDGTQRLFNLIPIFQKVLKDCVIIIDEIDRSLHTKATIEFINYFYQIALDSHAQLIATTHDSNIMNLDFIRQDEIWFVERQKDHSSRLYSLNQFKERFDKKVEKDYLIGRYGAIPIFNYFAFETQPTEDGDCGV